MARLRTAVLAAGTAVLVRRALRTRIRRSPLWPLPALEEPVSGRPRSRAMTLRVARRDTPAEGVVRLRLEGAGELPAWEPGAHLDLVLPSGTVRQYSLCGDPADRSAYTVATRLIDAADGGRGGSLEVHRELLEGTEVVVRGPRNRFPLTPAPAHVFVAGGIGITPLLPMVRAAHAAGADWKLLYGGRTRASMPFADELEKLGGPERVTLAAEDESGRPDLAAALSGAPEGTAVHCCGPEGLMAAVEAALPEGCVLRTERFAGGPAGRPSAARGDLPFEIELRRSGRTVSVPADRTALEAVREELPDAPYSCAQGFCGTCRQRVVSGEVDHRDELLTDGERDGAMLLCVSRSRGDRIVLDI
ncbi:MULTISPECIES: PDR/VanB family oxidoreductase [Streptomyces]|uniref:PDR/VanB family oxidoreductase n=1 Tax=Streptomyces TaxID=1883 RepID=UPI0018ACA896|nr:PDR/VanB family oxidoreductase [Streptomyces sp. BRB081]MBL3807080.1 oxidoreductase [Streptomyces sp. BRB081]